MDWSSYYKSVVSREPSRLLKKALEFSAGRGAALDLGAGMLQDSVAMLQAGFGEVLAVDASEEAEIAASGLQASALRFQRKRFENLTLPAAAFDLVLARDSLFFCAEENLVRLLIEIRKTLVPGGIFAADFLADRDDWNGRPGITCLSINRIESLIAGYERLQFFETEFFGPTAEGFEKQWHYVKVILRVN